MQPPHPELTQDRLPSLPVRHELTDTPFILQDDYQCGPASLAMVMGYYQHAVTPAELVPWVFTPDAQGSFPAEMDAVSRQRGFLSYPVNQLDEVLAEVAAGHPVLVLQNLATDWYPRWHFAVVVGYDLERQELVLRSGDLARRLTEFDLFDTTWARGKRWARVILPPQNLPATAQPERWLQAAVDLEQTGPKGAALPAFRSAVARWPDLAPARFGLATGLLNQGDSASARAEFEILLRQKPSLAAAWNNYSYALKEQGCPASARNAVACALKLEPGNEDFADSYRTLDSNQPDTASCGTVPSCPLPTPAPTSP
ncbi:MAG TPA: PA2778 family cysteine peptidase [Dongiaceae bacterium]|nr:PA2778 family cysteine peptidase [Dongiaceae bacterium]